MGSYVRTTIIENAWLDREKDILCYAFIYLPYAMYFKGNLIKSLLFYLFKMERRQKDDEMMTRMEEDEIDDR